jgi:hypothetical protein
MIMVVGQRLLQSFLKTDNAFIESLNGKFRVECVNANWFLSLNEARATMRGLAWGLDKVRPHDAIGNQVPVVLLGRPVTRPARRPMAPEYLAAGGPRLGASSAGREPPENMKTARKRQLVDEARTVWQVSIRRACQALPVDRRPNYRTKRSGERF